jgi:hypothetical protein
MYTLWFNYTAHNSSYPRVRVSQIYPPGHQPYIGNLRIVLEGGYTTFIPNYELLSDERGTNSIGKYDVISNNVMAAVGTAPTDYGNDIPILGGVYLSQNYLFVDYDHGFFGLAPVVSDPMIAGKRDIRTVCSSDPPQYSPGGTNHVAVIVGSVVGSVVGITLVVLVVWRGRRLANHFIRRRSPSGSGQSQEVAPPYPEVTEQQTNASRRLRHEDYSIGWVCALPIELTAARAILDEEHEPLNQDSNDTNLYTLGRICEHNVVIACLPVGQIGTSSAVALAIQMKSAFQAIRFGLMVGIGGGVPSDEADIRLGDIVVSQPQRGHGGVVPFEFGRC